MAHVRTPFATLCLSAVLATSTEQGCFDLLLATSDNARVLDSQIEDTCLSALSWGACSRLKDILGERPWGQGAVRVACSDLDMPIHPAYTRLLLRRGPEDLVAQVHEGPVISSGATKFSTLEDSVQQKKAVAQKDSSVAKKVSEIARRSAKENADVQLAKQSEARTMQERELKTDEISHSVAVMKAKLQELEEAESDAKGKLEKLEEQQAKFDAQVDLAQQVSLKASMKVLEISKHKAEIEAQRIREESARKANARAKGEAIEKAKADAQQAIEDAGKAKTLGEDALEDHIEQEKQMKVDAEKENQRTDDRIARLKEEIQEIEQNEPVLKANVSDLEARYNETVTLRATAEVASEEADRLLLTVAEGQAQEQIDQLKQDADAKAATLSALEDKADELHRSKDKTMRQAKAASSRHAKALSELSQMQAAQQRLTKKQVQDVDDMAARTVSLTAKRDELVVAEKQAIEFAKKVEDLAAAGELPPNVQAEEIEVSDPKVLSMAAREARGEAEKATEESSRRLKELNMVRATADAARKTKDAAARNVKDIIEQQAKTRAAIGARKAAAAKTRGVMAHKIHRLGERSRRQEAEALAAEELEKVARDFANKTEQADAEPVTEV